MENSRNIWQAIVAGVFRSREGLIIIDEEGGRRYSPREFVEISGRYGCGLLKAGVMPGDRVGILAQTTSSIIPVFPACWGVGAVAVPLPLPMRAMDPEAFIRQTRLRLEKVGARILVLPRRLMDLVGDADFGVKLVAAEELETDGEMPGCPASREDAAMVQFTSGSTSEPRGVVLTHGAILANAAAISSRLEVTPADRVVTWMPLYHDMGLIGFFITALASSTTLVITSPQQFVSDPSLWLRLMSEYRATVTGGPNFAYALVTRAMKSGRLGELDLSSLRLALNGAEPVDHEVLDEFVEVGGDFGLKPEVPYPVYGLAEATLAVTFPRPGERYKLDYVSRGAVEEGKATPVEPGDGDARVVVSLGYPLDGMEVAVFGEDGGRLGEREVGEVCVRGPSLMAGYWGDPAATAEALRGGWLHTGDLGYIAGGELHLIGRIKDMVIIGGRNLFPEDVERCAESVEGVRKGNMVAFGVTTKRGRERLVLVGETRLQDGEEAYRVACDVSERVRGEIGVPVREVVLVPPGTLPKTSSGKKRRFLCRSLYVSDRLEAVARSGAPLLRARG